MTTNRQLALTFLALVFLVGGVAGYALHGLIPLGAGKSYPTPAPVALVTREAQDEGDPPCTADDHAVWFFQGATVRVCLADNEGGYAWHDILPSSTTGLPLTQ